MLSSFKRLSGQLMLGPRGELGWINDAQAFQLDGELTRVFATYAVHYLKEYTANPDDHLYRVGLIYHSKQPHPWGSETLRLTDDVVRMIYPVSGVGASELTAFQKKKRENSIHFGTELLLTYTLKDAPDVPIFLPVLFDRGTTLHQYEHQTSTTVMMSEAPDTPVLEVLNLVGPATAARKNLDVFLALKERLANTLIKKDARRPVEMKIMDEGRAAPVSGKTDAPAPAPAAFTGSTTPLDGSALATDSGSRLWYNPALHDATCEKLSRFLQMPKQFVEVDQVRQLVRFRDLTMSAQKLLAGTCPVYMAPTNTLLLERGSNDQWNLFLLQGQLELTAADGEKKIVVGGSDNARNAIGALKPRKFAVTALTPVRFLWIHENIIAEIQQRQSGSKFELV